jgi:hypothetical protein
MRETSARWEQRAKWRRPVRRAEIHVSERDKDPNLDEFEYPAEDPAGDPAESADEHADNPHPDADGDVTNPETGLPEADSTEGGTVDPDADADPSSPIDPDAD